MNIDQTLLDTLTEQAKASPRLRMNMDLRDSAEDQSQRMLNALEPQASGCPAKPGMTEGGEVIVWL